MLHPKRQSLSALHGMSPEACGDARFTESMLARLFQRPLSGGLAVASPVLQRVVEWLDRSGDLQRDLPVQAMIERLCRIFLDLRAAGAFGSEDLLRLRNTLLSIDAIVEPVLEKALRSSIQRLSEEGPVSVLCLGCGGGSVETSLSRKLQLPLTWIGLDFPTALAAAPQDVIFLQPGHRFVGLSGNETATYRELAGLPESAPAVLLALYAVHHLPYRFDSFLRRAAGCEIVLLEQPIHTQDWQYPPWRWTFVAYDIYANIAMNPGWAAVFLTAPERFHVDYLTGETLLLNRIKTETISSVMPWTAVLELSASDA